MHVSRRVAASRYRLSGFRLVVLLVLLWAAPGPAIRSADAGLFTWTSSGPSFGLSTVLVVDPHCSEQIWGGGNSLYISMDGGATWQRQAIESWRSYPAVAIVADPLTAGVVYAAGNGLFKTTDSGRTWRSITEGLTDVLMKALAIDSAHPATLYAGTGNGIFKTTDGGEQWASASSGLTSSFINSLAVDPQSPQIVLAGTFGGMFRSTDGGQSWTGPVATLPQQTTAAIQPSLMPPYVTFAAVNGYGIYTSTNAGETWDLTPGAFPGAVSSKVPMAAHPSDADGLFVGTNAGLFSTTDGGTTWTDLSAGLPDTDVDSLAVDPASAQTLFAGTDAGWASKSTDGGASWAAASAGVKDDVFNAMVADPTAPGTVYASGDDGGIFRSTDAGESWTRPADSGGTQIVAGRQLALDATNPNTLYLAQVAGIWKSTDAGTTWARITTTGVVSGKSFQSVEIDPKSPATILGGSTYYGAYRSTDGGSSWVESSTGLADNEWSLSDFAFDPTTSQIVYLGAGSGVYRSTDGGQSWTLKSDGLGGDSILSLAVNPTAPTTVFAGGWGALHRSTNSGDTWTSVAPGGALFLGIADLLFHPADSSILYVAARNESGGVWRTADGGDTWERVGAPPDDPWVGGVEVSGGSPATLFASTWDGKGGVAQFTMAEPTPTPTPDPAWTPTPTPNVVAGGNCMIGPPDSATGTCPCFVDLDGDRHPSAGEPPIYFRWKDKSKNLAELVNPWQQCAPEGSNEVRLVDTSAVTACDEASGRFDTLLLASNNRRINITGWDTGGGFMELSGYLDQNTARAAAVRLSGTDADGDTFFDGLHFEKSGSAALDLTMFGTDMDEDGTIDYIGIPAALLLEAPPCARVAAGADVYCPVVEGGAGGVRLVFDVDGDGEADPEAPSSSSSKPADWSEVPVAASWALLGVLGAGLAGVLRGLRRYLRPLNRP
ncbi:MAG: hypothetical protein HYV63_24495 [Candidatus Schekmanbacteria bacterium]|nr:hypothetical protein [Candidatus Schekmanbacteria bacterium]